MLNNVLMVVSVAVEISSKYIKSYEVLMAGRFLIGINAGENLKESGIDMVKREVILTKWLYKECISL